MKIQELLESVQETKENFSAMFEKFLPLAMSELELTSLPKFQFRAEINPTGQPSFGMYSPDDTTLYVALANRHPSDILRTIAHELVHYRQDQADLLNSESGVTGSPEENQANQLAGVVMRNYNKKYPAYLSSKPLTDLT